MKMTIRAKTSVRGRRTSTEVLSNQHASQSASQQQQQQQQLIQGVAWPTPSYGQALSSVSCNTQQNRTKRKFEKIQKAKQRKNCSSAALSLSLSLHLPLSLSLFLCYPITLSLSRALPSPLTTLTLALTSSKTFGRANGEKNPKQAFFLTPSQRQRPQQQQQQQEQEQRLQRRLRTHTFSDSMMVGWCNHLHIQLGDV